MAKEAAKENKQIWLDYFKSIRSVCPWSYPAYTKSQIEILPNFDYKPLGKYLARVYIYELTSSELEQMMEHLNEHYPQEEWFFSHPSEGGHSSPYPCLIQQSHQHLQTIRKGLKSAI